MASKPIWQSRLTPAASQTFWPRSLHGRLVLIPSALLLLGLLGTIGVIFSQAKGRIGAEVTSSVRLGHDLAVTALRNVAVAASQSAAFAALTQDLPPVRHVEFGLAESDGTVRRAIEPPRRPKSQIVFEYLYRARDCCQNVRTSRPEANVVPHVGQGRVTVSRISVASADGLGSCSGRTAPQRQRRHDTV
jgi:hypothetical protein